jgi:hypothetical protein
MEPVHAIGVSRDNWRRRGDLRWARLNPCRDGIVATQRMLFGLAARHACTSDKNQGRPSLALDFLGIRIGHRARHIDDY